MSVFRPAALALALATALSAGAYAPQAQAANAPAVDIPYESFTLPNGLRVVVHTDRKAPIVAVNIWYHVGSKDEPAGRTGFAHLFEHLMFNGSENNPGEFFTPFKAVGATNQNGTTNSDRTNYFENVPTTALDMALWMESDRMGHLLGAIDQKTLDEQRGVVQNEKRQGENQPYGQVWDELGKIMYPAGHPYHHSTIGSMNDLNAASLDDVKTWFKTWYGPNNAVLVLAGDIDVATAKEKVAKYFGDIPATPTMAQPKVDVAAHTADSRSEMTDNVPQSRIYRVWNVAEYGAPDLDRLQLFAHILGGAKSSRLDKRLVHEDKLVDNISAGAYGSQLGSNFVITAAVKQGVDVAKVEAAIDEELEKLLKDGPTADELERTRTAVQAGWIRGVERIGGFGGKADALAECAVFMGDPGCFRESLKTLTDATPASVRASGETWLGAGKGSHTLVVNPGKRVAIAEEPAVTPTPFKTPKVDAQYKTTASAVDRKAGVPMPTSFPDLKFPQQQHATLSNGTKVVLAERHDIPVVQMSYEFRGGYAADPAGKPGVASFTMGLLDEGAGDLGPLAFADRVQSLGANLGASAGLDSNSAYLSALKQNLEPSVTLFADMLRKPRFEQADIDRVKGQWIAGIKQEKANPNALVQRVLPGLVFGTGNPYAAARTGSGTEAAIAGLTRADLQGYHDSALRPQDATLVVVGDTTLAEIVPVLEKHFGDWKAAGKSAASAAIPAAPAQAKPRVFLIDQPGAVQANIFAAQTLPSSGDAKTVQYDMANMIIGGDFTARLNMNLREDKHWSYGARSGAGGAVGQRLWMASAPVQIDKTGEATAEMRREIADYASGKAPAGAEEVDGMKKILTLSLPGAYETASAVMGTISGNVLYGRPDDYVFQRKAEIEAMTPEQVNAAAKALDPNGLTWLVVGDLSKTEAPIRALNLGEVTVLDADGKPVAKK
ncbi:insulinase family protein [Thermomonas brevis]|uniref:Insulinase family protein n=1 Tax=Thermomonas brevis TaxID=215691 RepID=A0A7G9QQ93_9GAMM|nr:pitrilysin family protein [Thermomonas brevis]QNN45518.1 insulinase family protein [Thermomonas brevis]